jgi:hypothetical protein
MTDKFLFLDFLYQNGIDVGAYYSINSLTEAIETIKKISNSFNGVVLKPRNGSGSRGVLIVNPNLKVLNEIIPDMVEQVQETEEEVIEEVEQIVAKEEILATESVEEENDFVIEKKIKPEEIIEEKPVEVKNDFEIKLKNKPEPKEIIEKPEVEIVLKAKPKKKSFNVSKVLKDIEQESKDFKKEQETTEEKQSDVFTDEVGEKMTISELELLKQQLYSCYTVPAGSKGFEDMKVQVQIFVNPDRTVKEAIIKNTSKMSIDPYFRTAGEAALRAFNHPNCSTLMLPEDKYDEWNEINFTFDFSWMFDKG